MTKYLKLKDGTIHNLAPLSYIEFIHSHFYYGGSSDTAFEEYLRNNNYVDILDFNQESLEDCEVVII